MDIEKPQPTQGGHGCLVGVVRIPVKIVAVLVVLPVRVVWDLLVAGARAAHRHVLGPLYEHVLGPVLRGLGWVAVTLLKLVFVWPWTGLWRYVLVPVGRGIGWLASGLYAHVLAPAGRALHRYLLDPLARGAMFVLRPLGWALAMALFVWPWVGLWRYVLRPVGLGLAWLATVTWRHVLVPVGRGFAWAAAAVYRYLLRPVGLGIAWLAGGLYRFVLTPVGKVIAWAWQVAGRITGALWRGFKWVGWILVGWPASRVYRHVLAPAGRLAREVWRTVRSTVREVRADVRRALFGTPPVEPARSRARTLGSTTAADAAPAAEISLSERRG
ncbi:hypothetical protein ABZX75_02005 [Streptomyces sp. NPDC003038]|uniref:hypothetical protein n=1 Tax=unclassified Streptomyces TaxID=2593676 RepID=UPI0033B14430